MGVEAFRQITAHRVGRAEDLESVEPETLGLVLDPDSPEPQRSRQMRQRNQRRGRVLRESGVKTPRTPGFRRTKHVKTRSLAGVQARGIQMIAEWPFHRFLPKTECLPAGPFPAAGLFQQG